MRLIIFVLLFVVTPITSTNNNTNEQSQNNSLKIIGGTSTTIEEIPYQISIRSRCQEVKGVDAGHICGGTLISQRAVLTAAHCLFLSRPKPAITLAKIPSSDIFVVMGNTYLNKKNSTEKRYGVVDVRTHNLYDFMTWSNDIAIMFIDGVVKWSSSVQWIGLNKLPIKVDTMCQVSGWDETEKDEEIDELLWFHMPIHDFKDCLNTDYTLSPASQLCIGYVNGKTGTCFSDTGGPLVCSGELVGIGSYSFSSTCEDPSDPEIFTNVSFFYDWIEKQNKTFNNKPRAKSMADSFASDRCWFIFALLVALLHTTGC